MEKLTTDVEEARSVQAAEKEAGHAVEKAEDALRAYSLSCSFCRFIKRNEVTDSRAKIYGDNRPGEMVVCPQCKRVIAYFGDD